LIIEETCGKLTCKILIVLDFDDTLLHKDGRSEDFTILENLQQIGSELCIASRNDRYHLEKQLARLNVRDYFRYVMADFRPKSYQIRHILMLYKKENCEFQKIFFVDDYSPNIERVRQDIPCIHSYQYGKDIQRLSELIELVN
jgi:HAD superfamily phosphatase (TIGR01681 family)